MSKTRNNPRILLIEDSADDEELLRLALAQSKLLPSIRRVSSRPAIAASLAEAKWDLILCDHNLPGLDSLDVLQMVAEHGCDTPFVILSGDIPDDQAIEAMRRGARDFIYKDALDKLVLVIERELITVDMAQELNRLNSNIQRMSDFDRLTGLPNRDNLLRYLERLVDSSRRCGTAFGLLLVDINRFSQIGRSLGPSFGNQVIAEVARRIAGWAGTVDFVARIGGDSFALVARDMDGEPAVHATAASLAEQVSQPMHIGPYELFISLNIGACCFPQGADRAEQLFANAETALLDAKQAGGNTHRLFHPAMAGTGMREIVIEGALHRALKNREFVLHYQPQIDLASQQMVSVEALIRWQHPEWGLVSPGEFIPLLEETGLIVPVGEWIIETACAQLRQWEDAGLAPLRMAVNLSALQFGDPRLTGVVAAALREHAVSPARLELEITESIVMQGKEDAISALQALRNLGVRIAVDDFGTGYSSLGYLKRFPITTLKIDQMFVHECEDNPQDQALVETMIQMGQRLNLEIVAEGVETQRQVDFLVAHGCDFAQGYLYGKPMPAEALAARLNAAAPSPAPRQAAHAQVTSELAT